MHSSETFWFYNERNIGKVWFLGQKCPILRKFGTEYNTMLLLTQFTCQKRPILRSAEVGLPSGNSESP